MELEICKFAPLAWERRSISSVCSRVTSGGTPSRTNPSYYNGAIPWVKTQELLDGWIEETEEHISERALVESSAKLLKPRSILMAMYGATVGRLGLLGREATCNQASCVMETNECVANFRYLYYQLLLHRSQIKSLATGAAQQNLSAATIRSFVLPFPPVAEQREIARILGALDDKIALNRQMNHVLEELSESIFQAWFIEFLPTRAKVAARAEGRDPLRAAMCALSGTDEAALDAMPRERYQKLAATAVLFPEELVDSELGQMPQGWKITSVADLSEKVGMGPFGSNIKVSSFVDTGIPIISGEHLHASMLEDKNYRYVAIEHADRLSGANVRKGDVVFTHAGNIGQVSFIPEESQFDRYILSQRQFYLRCDREQISPIFMTYFFRSALGQHRLLANASQVGVPSIAKPVSYLRSIRLIVPCQALSDCFGTHVRPYISRIVNGRREIQALVAVREALLPKLLSGEIRVGEAQELAEAAA